MWPKKTVGDPEKQNQRANSVVTRGPEKGLKKGTNSAREPEKTYDTKKEKKGGKWELIWHGKELVAVDEWVPETRLTSKHKEGRGRKTKWETFIGGVKKHQKVALQ